MIKERVVEFWVHIFSELSRPKDFLFSEAAITVSTVLALSKWMGGTSSCSSEWVRGLEKGFG